MKLIFSIVITIITLFIAWLFNENQSTDEIFVSNKENISNEEIETKLIDLTTLSERISKKNKYLNLQFHLECQEGNLLKVLLIIVLI